MTDDRPALPPKRRLRAVLWTVALGLSLPLVVVVGLLVALLDREIAATDWIVNRIEARAATMLQGGKIGFGQVMLTLGRDLHPRVRLTQTTLHDATGRNIARIPVAEGLISPRGLLFQGDVLLQEVSLTGAQIDLRRAADGSVAVAFGGDRKLEQAPSVIALLERSDTVLSGAALNALEQVQADGVIINYTDARAGRNWTVDGGQINLDLRNQQTSLTSDFVLLTGGADVTRLQMSYQSPRADRSADIGVSVTNARARDIASQTPALAWLADVDAALTATMRTGLNADGTLRPLNATLAIGAGALRPNLATEPLQFDAAKTYLSYDPNDQKITFDQIEITAPLGRIEAAGQAYLSDFRHGKPQSLIAQFDAPVARVAAGDIYADGLNLPPMSADLRLGFDPFTLEIGQIALSEGDSHITARGRISAQPTGWRVAGDAQADRLDNDRFLALWPIGFKPKIREWYASNVTRGQLSDAQFALRFEQGAPPIVAAQYEFEDTAVKYLRNLPPITQASGVVSLQDNALVVSLARGGVSAPTGGRADLAGSTFTVVDTRVRGGLGKLDLQLDSTITAALSLLDQPPVSLMQKAGRAVEIAQGRAQTRGVISFPLRKGVPQSEIAYGISATLRDVHSGVIIPKRALRANRLRLSATPQRLLIAGLATVDGIAVDATWEQKIGPEHAGKSALSATVALSQQALDAFNITLPPGTVTGAGQGTLDVALHKGRAPEFTLTSDLRGIGVSIPVVGWRKGRDTRGELRVAGTLGPVAQITTLNIAGGGLTAWGDVALNADGTLDRARFAQLQIGSWLDAPVTLRGRGKGRPVGITIGSGRVDLRGASLLGGDGQGGPLAVRLGRLQIAQGIRLDDFRGDFASNGGFNGQFSGRLNGGPRVQGTVVPQSGRFAIRLRSDDAGGVFGAAGFVKNAVGGSVDLTLAPTGGAGTFDGVLKVEALRIRDAPAMAALLDSISVVGLLRQLDGQGLAFDEVDATFRLTPSAVIVTQSSAVGPGLGISLDGIYMLANKQIDFQGVISPLYVLNGIGSIFTRKGEGLIGFNFNLAGTADDPQVSVNPLSAFTPGMFRENFRRPPPQVTQ